MMGTAAANWLLLASDLGRAFQAHSRRSTSVNYLLWFVAAAAVVAAFLAALYYVDRRRVLKTVKKDAEELLFHELCRVHGLTAAESRLLLKLAESSGQARRSDLFVDPAALNAAVDRGNSDSDRYVGLRRKLFGSEFEAD